MRSKHLLAGAIFLIILVISIMGGLTVGSFDFSLGEIARALAGQEIENREIIVELRLPRLLLAACTGGVLALSGFFMQALIKNPLADPYIMGVTAGAGFGVNLLILGIIPIAGFTLFTTPLFAATGSLASLILVLGLGYRSIWEDNPKLLIAGVAVSSIFTAMTGVLIYRFAESDQVRRLVFWTFGSFGHATPESVGICFPLLVGVLIFGLIYSRKMDILILGDLSAKTLGMNVPRVKMALLLVSSLAVGITVAFTGPIGFVGMMIPHFCRALLGATHRPNILLGTLMGAGFLTACDVLGRIILPPAGLPTGIITAILGVPFFLYVLFSRRNYL
ncbi:MAG: iron ABC transporter permease [Bacteroidia bacterium]|nr:iron ABC transporter permease [Bacteroidia bacterium]